LHTINQTKKNQTLQGLAKSLDGTPGRVRLGDFNNNGYPDIYLTLQLKNPDETMSLILTNVVCDKKKKDCVKKPEIKKHATNKTSNSTNFW
jgi:hypothetical protein